MSNGARPARRRPEVLAPAGDPLSLRAAIAAGADAVYLGMARFNARGRAERFKGTTLAACVRAAHDHGVRVYVTLNTLLHDDELPLAIDLAREARGAGADAAIVQDAGFAALLAEELPGFPLHGSTQMTIHQADQAAAAVGQLGLKRIIIARECSVAEVARTVERLRPLGAEVEVFVHGALCFAYSGQCLMSNFAGRRSANRGICAQNCRFDFSAGPVAALAPDADLAASAGGFKPLPVFDRRTATQLLSMKDLAAFESVARLADAGTGSFKIEGRLKGPEYVAEVTRLYRAALDAWQAGSSFSVDDAERTAGRVYSRGFTSGYLTGRLDPGMRGDKRALEGEPDATVVAARRKDGSLLLAPRPGHSVLPGQGYRYAHDRYRGGFRVLAAKELGPGRVSARVRFGAEASGRRHRRGATGRERPPPPLPAGLACYLNDDPDLERRIARLVGSVEIPRGPKPVTVRMAAAGKPGAPLVVRAEAEDGRTVVEASGAPLESARARPLGHAVLAEHLGRLGGTAYRLESLDVSALAGECFLGFPEIHALRQELVAALDRGAAEDASARPARRAGGSGETPGAVSPIATRLAACVANAEALEAAADAGAGRLVIDVARLLTREGEVPSWPVEIRGIERPWFRLPPIVHDEARERGTLERIRATRPLAGIVAGHLGQLARAREAGLEAAADFHLNATNAETIRFLKDAGAARVTLSLELEAREAAALARHAPPGVEVEVVIGGEVFSMLTRQPFGLEDGERFHAVSEHGHAYRFEAAGGITTLFEARELVGAEALPVLAGRVHAVRLDLAHQPAAAVAEIVGAYARALELLLAGPESEAAAKEAVAGARETHRRHAPAGAFTGHLTRGARALDGGG